MQGVFDDFQKAVDNSYVGGHGRYNEGSWVRDIQYACLLTTFAMLQIAPLLTSQDTTSVLG
jgi:hypothetical protein